MKFPSFVRIAVVPVKKLFEIKRDENSFRYTGIEAEFLNALSKLLRFKFEIIIPSDYAWGVKDTLGNWNGIIGMLEREEADIGLSDLDITASRNEVVDFSFPYDVSDKTFATEFSQPFPKYAAFIYPFDTCVWICIFVTFIFTCIMLKLLSSRKTITADYIIDMLGTLIRQPYEVKEKSYLWKSVFTLWCIFVTVVTFSYSGVLQAFLTIPLKTEKITTISKLSKAVEKGYYACRIANGTYDLYLLLGSKQRNLNILGQKALMNNWFYDPQNGSLHKYIEPYTAIMANRMSLSTPAFHDFYVSDDSFGIWYIGIAMRKAFCCKRNLDFAVIRILEAGLFKKFQKNEFHSEIFHSLDSHKHKTYEFTLQNMRGALYLLMGGLLLSIVTLIGEVWFHRYEKNVRSSAR